MPFLAAGYDAAWKLYQAQKPVLEKKLEGRGMKLLYSVAWPGQGIYTKEPLKTVGDLKGTKFRTYSPMTARLAELLGASPTVVQVPEVPQMFATGAIHAMITSSATGLDQGLGVRQELLHDERHAPEERRGGEPARLLAAAEGPAGRGDEGRRDRRDARQDMSKARERRATRRWRRTA